MSLDQHIQHLTQTIIGELRAPIEDSLRRLLEEVLATAGRERDEAIASAVAAGNARQEAAIDAALAAADAEAAQRHEQAVAALRAEAEQQLQQSLDAASAARVEGLEALDAVRRSAEADRQMALAALEADLARAHETELARLREGTGAEVAAAIEQARAEIAEQRDAGSAAWHAEREDLFRQHGDEVASLQERHRAELDAAREALARDHEAHVASLAAMASVERDAAIRAALDEAARERDQALAGVQARDEEVRAAAVRDTLAVERQADLACSERLLDSFRQLDSGQSLGEVLAALVDHVGREAGRSALLLVEGTRLRGWRLAGFAGLQPSDLDMPLDEAGPLARAATGGVTVTTSDPAAADALPALLLAPGGHVGLAVPLLVGQRAVAVLYADDAGAEQPVAPSGWPETAEVLVRHAARCLEVMTIARVSGPIGRRSLPPLAPNASAAPADVAAAVPSPGQDGPDSDSARQAESAQRYARLLLSEVKLYNESAVEEGRRDANLLERLGPEIERARRLLRGEGSGGRPRGCRLVRAGIGAHAGGRRRRVAGAGDVTVRSQETAAHGRRRTACALSLLGVVILGGTLHGQQPAVRPTTRPVPAALSATPRPAPPANFADLWLLPGPPGKPATPAPPVASFAAGAKAFAEARYADAIAALRDPGLEATPLAGYAQYFTALACLNTSRPAEARAAFVRLRAAEPTGYFSEAAALREAEAAAAQSDHAAAAAVYEALSRTKTGSLEEVLLAMARAYQAAGNRDKAAEGYRRLFYEFPASDLSATAATELGAVRDVQTIRDTPGRYKLELGRAERLFGVRRYAPAREAFDLLRPLATGDDAELVALRLAECDHYLRRYESARAGLAPFLDRAARKAEARFFYL